MPTNILNAISGTIDRIAAPVILEMDPIALWEMNVAQDESTVPTEALVELV